MHELVKVTYQNYLNLTTGEFTGDTYIELNNPSQALWTISNHSHPFYFAPNPFRDESYYDPIMLLLPNENGLYSYEFEMTNGDVMQNFYIELYVTADGSEPIPELPCKTKYFMEWTGNDLSHDSYRIDMCYKGYEGEPIQINGYCDLEYKSVKDVLECMRGSVANITIHATKELDINDFYFEGEKDVKVTFFRNEEVLFLGYLKQDGLWSSFVEENYNIQLDAIDNLGSLKNLALTRNGRIVTGRMTMMEVLSLALKRTGLDLPINVLIKKRHNTQPDGTNPLEYTRISTEQYYKEDGKTAMDCEKIIQSLLEPFAAIVHQWKGEWYVYSPLDLTDNTTFLRYDELGEKTDNPIDVHKVFGSAVNHFDWHHINKNQQIRIKSSLGAFRVHYQYGKVHNVLKNGKFVAIEGDVEGWDLLNGAITGSGSQGVYMPIHDTHYVTSNSEQNILIEAGTALNISLDFTVRGSHTGVLMRVKLGDRYLNGDTWGFQNNGVLFENYDQVFIVGLGLLDFGKGRTTISLETQPAPVSGVLEIDFYTVGFGGLPASPSYASISELRISAGNESSIIGEFHTVESVDDKSSDVMDVKKVHHGDGGGNFYLGTLHDLDDEPTEIWFKHHNIRSFPILTWMAIDTMIMRHKPQIEFTGDIYRFFPYLLKYEIDGINAIFVPTSYIFRSKENITELEGVQFYSDFSATDEYDIKIEYETRDNPGVNKPTIR